MLRPFIIIRLRPLALAAEGYTAERLHAIGEALSGRSVDSTPDSITITYPTAVAGVEEASVDELIRIVQESLSAADIVIIDANFDHTEARSASVDLILGRALSRVAPKHLVNRRVVALVERVESAMDDLAEAFHEHNASGRMGAVDPRGKSAPRVFSEWLTGTGAFDLIPITARELRGHLSSGLLRRRGVFHSTTLPDEFWGYLYSGARCTTELELLLAEYLSESEYDYVVYDPDPEAWFTQAVVGACSGLELPAFAVDEVLGANDDAFLAESHHNVSQLLAQPERAFCLIGLAYKNGRRLLEMRGNCERAGRAPDAMLVVLCEVPEGRTVVETLTHNEVVIDVGPEAQAMHFLVEAELNLLDDEDWRIVAARQMSEIEGVGEDWKSPSRVGLWSLMHAYGGDREYSVPAGRGPILAFPQLNSLHALDALWLAECLLRRAEARVGHRSGLLLILPEEQTASKSIGAALDEHMVVSVAKIGRSVLEGQSTIPPETAETILQYRHLKVVLLDESSATYSTFRKMNSVVRSLIGRDADLHISVIELPLAGHVRSSRMESLIAWNPLRVGSVEE